MFPLPCRSPLGPHPARLAVSPNGAKTFGRSVHSLVCHLSSDASARPFPPRCDTSSASSTCMVREPPPVLLPLQGQATSTACTALLQMQKHQLEQMQQQAQPVRECATAFLALSLCLLRCVSTVYPRRAGQMRKHSHAAMQHLAPRRNPEGSNGHFIPLD